MQPSFFVRPLTQCEEIRLGHCVRGRNLFSHRRAQIIVASSRGVGCRAISVQVGLSLSMVRYVIRLFNRKGVSCLVKGSTRPHSAAPVLDAQACEALRHLLHQSPRSFGQTSSLWTLDLLAQVAFEHGITPRLVSADTISRALKRLGYSWTRAKAWISSPDPHYARKKSGATA